MKQLLARCLTAFCCLCCSLAYSKEFAFTVRATELKAEPFSDAATSAKLTEHLKVEVLTKKVSWTEIKTDSATGWVKMLSLRFDNGEPPAKADSGIKSMYNLATTGSSGSTVTTGVRGLDEKKLLNPIPNKQAFEVMHNYAANAADAQKFATLEKLEAHNLGYVAADGGKK